MPARALARTREYGRRKATMLGDRLVKTAEVSFGAFVSSAISTRMGGVAGGQWLGMPVELVSALALYGVAVLGEGDYAEDVFTIGDGAFAAYLANLGRQAGARARLSAPTTSGQHHTALYPAAGGHHLPPGTYAGQEMETDEDIATLLEMAGPGYA